MGSKVTIFTDGSCNNTTHDKGGFGIVIINGSTRYFHGGSFTNTTSARMEIRAIIKALELCKKGDEVEVYSDNRYAVNALKERWVFRWQTQNFRDIQKPDGLRANADLWRMFLDQYCRLEGKVELKWVKGHNGNHYNETADMLANQGAHREIKIKDRL